jgi:putative FmdB family regulatory protein
MPLYDYECECCGPFISFHLMADRDEITPCPDCKRSARRVISAPNLALMPAGVRKAHATNERSRHAPRVARRHRCGSGCGCPDKKSPKTVASKVNGESKLQLPRRNNRPWMLGH